MDVDSKENVADDIKEQLKKRLQAVSISAKP